MAAAAMMAMSLDMAGTSAASLLRSIEVQDRVSSDKLTH
jgi:hypothetical protein